MTRTFSRQFSFCSASIDSIDGKLHMSAFFDFRFVIFGGNSRNRGLQIMEVMIFLIIIILIFHFFGYYKGIWTWFKTLRGNRFDILLLNRKESQICFSYFVWLLLFSLHFVVFLFFAWKFIHLSPLTPQFCPSLVVVWKELSNQIYSRMKYLSEERKEWKPVVDTDTFSTQLLSV